MGKAWIENGGTVAAGAEANIAKLAEAASSYGFIDINPDPDGTLRHALLIMRYRDQDFFPSLALQSVREYEKIPDQEIAAYIAETGLERIQFGKHLLHAFARRHRTHQLHRPLPDLSAILHGGRD